MCVREGGVKGDDRPVLGSSSGTFTPKTRGSTRSTVRRVHAMSEGRVPVMKRHETTTRSTINNVTQSALVIIELLNIFKTRRLHF